MPTVIWKKNQVGNFLQMASKRCPGESAQLEGSRLSDPWVDEDLWWTFVMFFFPETCRCTNLFLEHRETCWTVDVFILFFWGGRNGMESPVRCEQITGRSSLFFSKVRIQQVRTHVISPSKAVCVQICFVFFVSWVGYDRVELEIVGMYFGLFSWEILCCLVRLDGCAVCF